MCGHWREPNAEWRNGGDSVQFPILDTEWRIQGDVDMGAYRFVEISNVPFSAESVRQLALAGSRLANNYSDFRLAARQVQELHMGEVTVLASNARELLDDEAELGDQIARLYEVGALPYYDGPSAGNDRTSGPPYDEPKTHFMVSKLRADVREGMVLAVRADSISPETPIIPTQTAIVPRILHGRTIATYAGINSDMRLNNLFRGNANYKDKNRMDISEIASRAITTKRTRPDVQVVCCKRDIDGALKMGRTHPDICVLLRALSLVGDILNSKVTSCFYTWPPRAVGVEALRIFHALVAVLPLLTDYSN